MPMEIDRAVKQKINDGALQISSQDNVAKKFLTTKSHAPNVVPQLAEFRNLPNGFPSLFEYNPHLYRFYPQYPAPFEIKPLEHIFKDFGWGHILFFGPAGSGKTSLLNAIAQNVMKKKYESLTEVEIVVFLKCCDLNPNAKLPPREHLLSNVPNLTKAEQNVFSKFALANPKKVLFLLDSLDTFTGDLGAVKQAIRKPGTAATSAQTLYSLLCGELFPGCRVITTTRDYTSDTCKNLQLNKIIGLVGLTVNDVYTVIRTYFEDESANKIMQELQKTPWLIKLCQIPVFLVFTLIGKKSDPNFAPTTMSQILVFLFQNFLRSKHAKENEIEDVVRRLQPLAFNITLKARINFVWEDLEQVGLDVKKIKDLAITLPGGHDDNMICFIHQSIQEMLTTFHIAGMKLKDFCAFVTEFINYPGFFVIRRMLCGILCNEDLCEEAKDFFEADDLAEKRAFLLNALKKEIEDTDPLTAQPRISLELIISLYEAGDGASLVIKSHLKRIALYNLHPFCLLSPSDLYIICSIICKCDWLEMLAITNGNLKEVELALLFDCLSHSNTQITQLDFTANRDITPVGFGHLGRIAKHCKTEQLVAHHICDLTKDHLDALKATLDDYQLKRLDISHYPDFDTEEKMTEETRCRVIPISFTPDLESLPSQEVKQFASVIKEFTMDISEHRGWTAAPYDFVYAIACLLPNISEELVLYGWKISTDHYGVLQSKLDENHSNLKVHLTKDVVLSARRIVHAHFAGGGGSCELSLVDAFDQEFNLMKQLGSLSTSSEFKLPAVRREAWSLDHHAITQHLVDFPNFENASTTPLEVSVPVTRPKDQIDENFLPKIAGQKFWDQLMTMSNIEELNDFLSSHDPEDLENLIRKLRITQKTSKDDMTSLSNLLLRFSHLDEMEFRCYNLDAELLRIFLDTLQDSNLKKISTLSITGTEKVEVLLPSICKMMQLCKTEGLNIEESKGGAEFCKIFQRNLEKFEVTQLRKFDLSYIKNIGDFITLGHILARGITELKMVNCDLKSENLKDICKGLGNNTPKLEYLDLSYNTELCEDGIAVLPQMLAKDKVRLLSMRGCELSEDELDGFDTLGFQAMQIEELDFSYNTSLLEDGCNTLCNTLKKLRTEKLALAGCNLDGECLNSMMTSLDGHKLSYFDVSGNGKITSEIGNFVKLLKILKTKHLDVSECKLGPNQITTFAKLLGSYKLARLNLSDSERRIDHNFIRAVCGLIPSVEEELVAVFLNMDKEHEEIFQNLANDSIKEAGSLKPTVVFERSRRQKSIEFLRITGPTVI